MRRLAVLSLHTSPLAQPGTGDGGGMNVYVRELAAALARTGVDLRRLHPGLVARPPRGGRRGARPAGAPRAGGPPRVPGQGVPARRGRGVHGRGARAHDRRVRVRRRPGRRAALHLGARQLLALGLSGHVIKHELDLPLVCTFHTLDRVKAESMPEEVEADMPHRRAEAEASVINCSDAVLASCTVEADQIASLYGGDPGRIRIVPPASTTRSSARATGPRPAAPSACPSTAGRCSSSGGSSRSSAPTWRSRRWPSCSMAAASPTGWWSSAARAGRTARSRCRGSTTSWTPGACASTSTSIEPQPHELLSSYYRAADVCLVPSRSESFGLVALEAAACGTPVVASAVGGLTTLVDHGHTGFLVEDPDRRAYADAVRRVFDEPLAAERFSTASVLRARRYTWRAAAASWWSCTTSWPPAGSSSQLSAPGRSRRPEPCRSSISPPTRRWRPPWRASTPGPSAELAAGGPWWRPSARRSPTARRRTAGTCASQARRRTSSRSG